MPEQRYKEFYATERVAMGYLTAPQTVPKVENLNRWRFCLRLWHYPSFQASYGWGIYQFHESDSRLVRTQVRQVTWDREFDARRFSDPLLGLEQGFQTQPTIEIRDRPIDTAAFDSRLATLARISFPAFAAHRLGLDGEIFGVALPNFGPSIEWWCEGPESWSELTVWATDMRGWLCGVTAEPPNPEVWARPRSSLP